MLMKWLRRQAILWHRYLGVCFCLFFAIWFVSGVVLMYAGMPQMSEPERLAHLPALDLSTAKLSPAQALEKSGASQQPLRIAVGMLGNRPVYRVLTEFGSWVTVFADDGSVPDQVDGTVAAGIASQYGGIPVAKMHAAGEVTEADQWTVYPGSESYFPFQKLTVDDGRGTEYYVSEASASVYLETNRRSRILAWLGAIPHWWYIRALRAHADLWADVMIGASGLGILLSLAGIAAGLLRFSPSGRYRFPGGRRSSVPYAGWKRWHYLLAAAFGLATFTWIFSGLMTMDPGNWSPGPDPGAREVRAFSGGDLDAGLFRVTPAEAAGRVQGCFRPVELDMMLFRGQPYYLARGSAGEVQLVSAAGPSSAAAGAGGCNFELPSDELRAAGQEAEGGAAIAEIARLDAYDAYYYDRDRQRLLPVLRIRFADPRRTWLYLSPRTGRIVARFTNRSRIERWLYSGLHDLDFPFLYWHRPAWDITVIVLSLGGLALSLTSIALAWRYLRTQLRKVGHVLWVRSRRAA